ncbi:MAG: TonB-dependent receptor [Pseudomonadota bacterium]
MRERSAYGTGIVARAIRQWAQAMAIGSLVATLASAQVSAETSVALDIPAQSLATALEAYSNATGISVVYATATVSGLRSSPINGALTPQDALARLTTGTGVVATFVSDSTVRIEPVTQPSEGSEAVFLDQILVQGELLTRTLQETQTSVTVATGAELEQRGDRDVFDLVERAPNVTQTGGGAGFSIRGIDGAGSLISLQVDGVAVPGRTAFAGFLPTWDVEQVEVLRGPQSTQQGRNALAGAIVLRTRDPVYTDEYRLRTGVGSGPFYEGAVSINKVLEEDRAALRLSGQVFRDGGYVENPTLNSNEQDRTDLENGRAKLRLNPSDDFEAIASYSFQRTEHGLANVNEASFPGARVRNSNLDEFLDLTEHSVGLRLSYDINDHFTIESESNYLLQFEEQVLDLDNSAANDGASDGGSKNRVFEQDLRLLYDGDGLSATLGFFYADTRLTSDGTGFTGGALIPFPLPPGQVVVVGSDVAREARNWAVFGEVEFEAEPILPGLSFVLGARYDQEEQEALTTSNIFFSPGPTPPLPIFGVSQTATEAEFDAFLPKAGVIYEWSPGITTSFTFQQGYRAGGANFNVFNQVVNEFDPEFTNNYEIAFRGEFLDGDLVTNTNIFLTQWRDQQVQRFGPGGAIDILIENAGESRLFGGELSVDYRASDNLDLFFSLGHVQTKYLSFITGADDFTGNAFPNAPKWTGAAGAAYFFDNGLSVGVDASYTSQAFAGPQNDPNETSDPRFLVNAQVNYEYENFLLGAYVRNLFNVAYSESDLGSSVRTGEPFAIGGFVEVTF